MTSASAPPPAVRRSRAAAVLAILVATGCASRGRPAVAPAPSAGAVEALRTDLARIFGAPVFARASWSVEVASLDHGEVLFARDASRLMMPASNMKIVTLAAAAERLGWDHRFETRLVSSAPVAEGVLQGDLIVVGGGDPSINERDGRAEHVFDEWAAALQAAGVRRVEGRVVGDDRAFDREGLGAGWAWDYLAYGYATPVGALQFNENVVRLTVRPAASPGGPAGVTVEPDGSGLEVANRLVTGPPDSDGTIQLRRLPTGATLEIVGSVPAGAEPIVRTASVDDPAGFFARAARAAFAARGIEVDGPGVSIGAIGGGLDLAGARVLATSLSPPLTEIATVLMKISQNLYAETLIKALGRGEEPGSTARGLAVVRDVLAGWGIDAESCQLYDGSGLSRYNYVTAGMLVTILRRLHEDDRHRDAFLATLPIAGRDGTIGTRLNDTRAADNARAKTGTIANVRALSGFVTTRDGERLVFSILANDYTVPTATIDYAVDLAVESLANFTRRD